MLSPDWACRPLDGNLLLTGATGFVGAALLAEILASTQTDVACLVRSGDEREARGRVLAALRPWLGVERAEASLEHVRALPADLTSPDLGLSERVWHELAEWSTHIVHCAATVRFDEPLATARAVNVAGVQRVLDLAQAASRAGSLVRVLMVSTAFVAGTSGRPFAEHELDLGQGFRNTYERSKFEAEQIVRRAAADLPICVVRPSVVVGHSVSGQTTAFNVLYAPLRLFIRHAASATLPVRAGTTIDTVPVDWVARLILAALAGGRDSETYAAASGYDALTVGDVAAIAAEVFDIDPPCVLPADASDEVVLQAGHAWGQRLTARQGAALEVYTPYLVREARFDSWRGERLMQLAGERFADPRVVMTRCLEYARATNFGRLRADALRRTERTAIEARSAVA